MKEKIRDEICRICGHEDIGFEEDLFSSGILDSLNCVKLTIFIEEQFGVEFDLDDVTEDEFRTIEGICRLIRKKNENAV